MVSTIESNITQSTGGPRVVSDQAIVQDLRFIRGALNSAAIPFLLIRTEDGRPALVVDVKRRGDVSDALEAACKDSPWFTAIATDTATQILHMDNGIPTGDQDPLLLRIFRNRDGVRPGATTGVELQFWAFGSTEAVAPIESSLTRKVLPINEIRESSIKLYGRTWRTIAGMFAPHSSDITFDIDIVFSWVDGSDPEFRKRRAAAMTNHVVGEGDDAEARIRQIDELKYALRSVHAFAPWIRRIFIATDSPTPAWLAPHPKVSVVRAQDHFTNLEALPVYNSHAVECQLHHIPELSEHFLYSNDDMFFGRTVSPSMFFSPGGITKFIEAGTRIGLGTSNTERSGFENAARVNRELLWNRFGKIITRHLEHTAAPLRKSVLLELEREFPVEFARTQCSRFRAATDISVTNSLYHYYSLLTGRAVQHESAVVRYVDTTAQSGLAKLPELLDERNVDFFCLNDGSFPEVDAHERAITVCDFLESYFPVAAPWEHVTAA